MTTEKKIFNPDAPLVKHRFWVVVILAGILGGFLTRTTSQLNNLYDIRFQSPVIISKQLPEESSEDLKEKIRQLEASVSALLIPSPTATPSASVFFRY